MSFPTGFGPGTYGSSFADVYDRWYGGITDATATARFTAERCTTSSILELGVGTGRLVGELQAQGLTVIGVDSSAAMLDELTDGIGVCADITHLPLRGTGRIGGALCAFNTLFNLPTVELQAAVLSEAAAVVEGPIIIEAMTGRGLGDADPQSVGISRLDAQSLVLAATLVDHSAQTVTGQHVEITEQGIKLRPWHLRWSTPEEVDAMAKTAGLRLTERYSDWSATPFNSDSDTHVSVYRK